MLESYTVCAFCFKNLEHGSQCECLTSHNCQQKYATRYTESFDMDLNESHPNIVGQEDWSAESANMSVPGTFVGAKVVLAPEVQLCEGCQADFEEACEWIADIITRCMASDGSKGLEDSDTLIGKRMIKEKKDEK